MVRVSRQFDRAHRLGLIRTLALVDLAYDPDRQFVADVLQMFTQPENQRLAAAFRSGSFGIQFRFDGRAVLFPLTDAASKLHPLGLRPERRCRGCGCTDSNACLDGRTGQACRWVEPNLCSACVGRRSTPRRRKKIKR